MAIPVLFGHDLNGPTANRPTNAEAGQPFFDTTLGLELFWNGSSWVTPGGGSFDAGTAATSGTGGTGGGSADTYGAGGTATTGTGGTGGAAIRTAGAGGAASGVGGVGGVGGAQTIASGAGGASTNASGGNGGAAGAMNVTGAAGGATAATSGATGGAGSTFTISAGAGGAASAGTSNGGPGGNLALSGGAGGTSAGGTAGAPGTVTATGFIAQSRSAAAISAARTLTAADSGGCFSVAKTSAYAITLPTPAQGIRFKFLTLDTGAFAVTISDGSAHLKGVISINNVSTAATGTTITLVATASVGDWLEFEGISSTQYLVTGACIAAGKITVA